MDPEWKVTQEDLHKYLDVLLVLVKECGDIISDAITNRVNVEIDEKVENVGEGNSSAILTETDLKVILYSLPNIRYNLKKKITEIPKFPKCFFKELNGSKNINQKSFLSFIG